MRRIISLILLVLVFTSSCAFASHTSIDTLSALNASPEEFSNNKSDNAVSRAEFAYIASKILLNETKPQKDTRFTDVTASNKYSGYIEFLAEMGIISGVDGSSFYPDAKVNIHMASKILICILGCSEYAERYGGYPSGYYDLAYKLRLFKGVKALTDGVLSQGDAARMVENALFAEIGTMVIRFDDGGVLELDNEPLIQKTFGIGIYNGTITDVAPETCSANFTATSKEITYGKSHFSIGTKTYVDADSVIDLNKWENVPVTVWVNSENKIIYVYEQNGIEVRYEYIDSINGDIRDGALYSIGHVNRLTMRYDEYEYDVSNNAVLKYNEKNTTTAVPLVGNFAKIVLKNNEVMYIESWEMKEGGIVTSASSFEIVYTKGRTQNFKIEEIDKFKNKKIFIDGRSADISELKADSVFFYNITDDVVVILATEKCVYDILESYTSEELTIGNALYKRRNLYYSEDGVNYKEDGNFTMLLGREVKAYLAPDGYVLYLRPGTEGEVGSLNKFYGVVIGVERESRFDEEKVQIKMYRVENGEVSEEIYETDKYTEYLDGLDLQNLIDNSSDLNGQGVYYFELRRNGKIKNIRMPYYFEGFEGESTVTSFVTDSKAQLVAANGKYVFFEDVKITAIFEQDGEFKVECHPWSVFNGRRPRSAKVRFYGNGELASLPTVILMTGNFTGIGNRFLYHGIVTDISDGVNEEGAYCKNVTFVGNVTKKYQLKPSEANDLKLYDLVAYYDGQLFTESEIYRSGTHINLVDVINSWQPTSPLKVGYVKFIDSRMIRLEDGEAYYFNSTGNYFAQMHERADGKYNVSSISYKDIMPGDRVIYVAATDGTRGIIKITD